MTNKDLFEALRTFEKEKGIPMDYMLQNIEKAISVACKNYYGGNENVVFKVDPEKNSFDAKLVKTVVDEVFDPNFEVTVEEAQQINKRKKFIVGDEIEVPIDPKHLGWTSVSSARNVIRQGIRQGEKGQTLIEFQSKLGEIVTATVERIDPKSGVATIKIGKSEATLPKSEQLGHDDLKEGDHIKVYIADVKDNERGPHAIISRTHPGLVKRLFEQEVPEINDGLITIKKIARIPGERAKIAVESYDERIDPVGACVGVKGSRIHGIVRELRNENIDVINYTSNIQLFIQRALSPAKVSSIVMHEEEKKAEVYLKPEEVSLAIGKGGMNIKLASMLTEYTIDVYRELDESTTDEDIYLDEFKDEIDEWVINAIKSIGIETAKGVLNAPREMLIEKADLEENTVDDVLKILRAEFEDSNS